MKQFHGFTLIELLVVIVIIGLLAGIVLSAAGSISLKSQIKNTQGTILALITACEQYRAMHDAYPNLDFPSPGYPGATGQQSVDVTTTTSAKYSDAHYKEFNKRLRYMLEERAYIIDEVTYEPPLGQSLPQVPDSGDTSQNKFMYADGFGNFLRVCPGRDHTLDTPRGPNNLAPDKNRPNALLARRRSYFPPDIFSLGPNDTNDIDTNGTQIMTQFDTNTSGNDDIVSWIADIKYCERNYMRKMKGE